MPFRNLELSLFVGPHTLVKNVLIIGEYFSHQIKTEKKNDESLDLKNASLATVMEHDFLWPTEVQRFGWHVVMQKERAAEVQYIIGSY